MKTKNFLKNSMKSAALFLFAVATSTAFTACDNDIDDEMNNEGNSQKDPIEDARNMADHSFDDKSVFLNTLGLTDENGNVVCRYYGEPLDSDNPKHLFIGVDKMDEAKDMFRLWMAPDVEVTENSDGSLTAELTDEQGHEQGTVTLSPGEEENHIAEVTADIDQQHFTQITFLKNEAWPVHLLQTTRRYYKFDIVKNVRLNDIVDRLLDNDRRLNFVCIQGSANGVKPVFCAITNERYMSPLNRTYNKIIRDSRYTPGSGTFPTAANIQNLLLKDWSTFVEVFKEAGSGPLIAGTEYWWDESHWSWFQMYTGVMDYHSGYTYGEGASGQYYFLFRMYGLDDSKISDGMSF